jgi:hypothetical protein
MSKRGKAVGYWVLRFLGLAFLVVFILVGSGSSRPVWVAVGFALIAVAAASSARRSGYSTVFGTGGTQLSPGQRNLARRSVHHNSPPQDPSVAQAAVSLARYGMRFHPSQGIMAVLFVVVLPFEVKQAMADPLWWAGVVIWLVLGTVYAGATIRLRRSSRRYLATVGHGAPRYRGNAEGRGSRSGRSTPR